MAHLNLNDDQKPLVTDSQASSPRLSSEQLSVVIANTVAVMTTAPGRKAEWRKAVEWAYTQALQLDDAAVAELNGAILNLLDGTPADLPDGHPYQAAWREIAASAAARRPQAMPATPEMMQAVRDFMRAEDWEASQRVVEAQQALLLTPEVEALLAQTIAQARADGKPEWAANLEGALALLRDCQASGIEAAFTKVRGPRLANAPVDAELMPRTLAALRGGPEEKRAHAEYLAALASHVAHPDYLALINAIQLALSGGELAQLGQALTGLYAQAWQSVVAALQTGGVDSQVLELIVDNTQAVLTRAPEHKSEWRHDLLRLRHHAMAQGARPFIALLDAVLGLLDAGGDAAGLGDGLEGDFAQTWQRVLDGIGAGSRPAP